MPIEYGKAEDVSSEVPAKFDTLGTMDLRASREVLRHRFDTDGAFVIRGLFEPSEIFSVRSAVLGQLNSAGWIYDAAEGAPQANMEFWG